MSLVIFDQVSFALGDAPLLDKCSFVIQRNERIALVGRNGVGKSTLLKLMTGHYQPDDGDIKFAQGIKIGHLAQELPAGDARTVLEVVLSGLEGTARLLQAYAEEASSVPPNVDRLAALQNEIEQQDGWALQTRAETICSRLGLNTSLSFADLSGGWRRRVMLARALLIEPDLLFLDEPTNHLDIKMIEWLEELLLAYKGTILFVSHDRAFIDRISSSVMDLDRGQISRFPAPYGAYLEAKEDALKVEEEQRAQQDKVLAKEETWIRQGIKARRTRNEGRVRALKQLRNEVSGRRSQQGQATFAINSAERSGKKVFELTDVSFAFDEQTPILRDFSDVVMRGEKIALLGPNGVGKSTLIKLLLKEIEPQQGDVAHGTNISVAYFDQAKQVLDADRTVMDVVSEGRDFIDLNGTRRHVMSYLEDFMFRPERSRMKVRQLSGGEVSRLLLARLFSQPANLLVLDEPTNDLDMDTLELLVEKLSEFEGTALLVSHDRYFIDQIATRSWAFEGNGRLYSYPGGYEDWIAQGGQWPTPSSEKPAQAKAEPVIQRNKKSSSPKTKKLSYIEQREFDAMPDKIQVLESEIETLETEAGKPDFYTANSERAQSVLNQLTTAQKELEVCYDRWAELEAKLMG